MYKTRFAFRDGHDAVLVFESYDEARNMLLGNCISCRWELLYAEVVFQSIGYRYTTDLIDMRLRTDGRIISLGDFMSIRSAEGLCVSECCVDEIDTVGGRLKVTVFGSDIEEGWYGIERFL